MLKDQSPGSLGDVWEKKKPNNPAASQEQGPSPKKLSLPSSFFGQWLSLCLGCVGKLDMG